MTTREILKKKFQEDKIKYILVQFIDINGAAKVKMVPITHFDNVIDEGAGFAGAAVMGLGQGPHSHDMLARVDLDTYTVVPWDQGIVRFAADLFVDDKPYMYDPRQNLKKTLKDLETQGFVFNVGIEPEHFLVVKNEKGDIQTWDPDEIDTLDKPCYDFKGIANASDYLRDLMDGMENLGWDPYQSDHEDANGQYEINFTYSDALNTADRYTFFKMMSGQFAKKYGAIATYMAKPFSNKTGSAGHIHFHLADAKTGENLFIDYNDPRGLGLSEMAYNFIGGILTHAKALCAINSPTVNCYKRLQIGSGLLSTTSGHTWTPAFLSYGDNNRTQMIRTAGPGNLEDRTISAASNPYLVFAAYVTAGIDGINRSIDPGDPFKGNLYELTLDEISRRGIEILPQNLNQAIENLKQDSIIETALGVIYPEFIRLKEAEWRDYHKVVSKWEIDRYLTMF